MATNFKRFHKKPIVFSIIFFAFCCATLFFVYRQIKNNNQLSAAAQSSWQTEADSRAKLQSLDRSLKEVAAERAMLDSHFIQSSDVVPFLDMLEKVAPTVGAKVEVSSVDIAKDGSGLNVEVKATGRFESVYKFLMLLENSPYELSILSTDMSTSVSATPASAPTPADWTGDFRIKLLSFFNS
jgi:hypothetical protein